MYTAVVLDADSQGWLVASFQKDIPEGWEVIAHHMTCNMGAAHEYVQPFIGQTVDLVVKSLAIDDLVVAVGVECVAPSTNLQKHITLAVNRAGGGKPFLSNKLKDWVPVNPITLRGTVTEVSN